MIKGIFGRISDEIRYIISRNWSYVDSGNFWDTVHDYDEIDDETYAYKRRFTDSSRLTSMKKGSKVLDIDCRTGNGTVFFRRKVKEATCVSPSKNFLKICKKRMNKYGIEAKTILLKRMPLALKSNSFNQILCFETIEHVSNKDRLEFLKELNRLMDKNGEMILTTPNILWEPVHWFAAIFGIHHSEGPHAFLTLWGLRKLLREAGFSIKKEETTVIIPAGPRWLTRLGEKIEKIMGAGLKYLALRHILICKKT